MKMTAGVWLPLGFTVLILYLLAIAGLWMAGAEQAAVIILYGSVLAFPAFGFLVHVVVFVIRCVASLCGRTWPNGEGKTMPAGLVGVVCAFGYFVVWGFWGICTGFVFSAWMGCDFISERINERRWKGQNEATAS